MFVTRQTRENQMTVFLKAHAQHVLLPILITTSKPRMYGFPWRTQGKRKIDLSHVASDQISVDFPIAFL